MDKELAPNFEEDTKELLSKLMQETDVEKVKDLTHLFNANMSKKNTLRVLAMDNLVDKVTKQIEERFEKYPDNFSNTDLLNYLQALQTAIEKANKQVNAIEDTPAIQLNTDNVTVNVFDNISSESKNKIAQFLAQQLASNNKEEVPKTYVEEVYDDGQV